MSWTLMLWALSDIVNLGIIMNLVWQTKKEIGHVSWAGVIHLAVFSGLLGPIFTALCIFFKWLERQDR